MLKFSLGMITPPASSSFPLRRMLHVTNPMTRPPLHVQCEHADWSFSIQEAWQVLVDERATTVAVVHCGCSLDGSGFSVRCGHHFGDLPGCAHTALTCIRAVHSSCNHTVEGLHTYGGKE